MMPFYPFFLPLLLFLLSFPPFFAHTRTGPRLSTPDGAVLLFVDPSSPSDCQFSVSMSELLSFPPFLFLFLTLALALALVFSFSCCVSV